MTNVSLFSSRLLPLVLIMVVLGVFAGGFAQESTLSAVEQRLKDTLEAYAEKTTTTAIEENLNTIISGNKGDIDPEVARFLRRRADVYRVNFEDVIREGKDKVTNEDFVPLFLPDELDDWSDKFSVDFIASPEQADYLCNDLDQKEAENEAMYLSLPGLRNQLEPDFVLYPKNDYQELRRQIYQEKALLNYANEVASEVCLQARVPNLVGENSLPGPSSNRSGYDYFVQQLLPGLINFLLVGGLALAVLALVIVGLMFVGSGLNPESRETAKTALLWILVGIALMLTAFGLVRFITEIQIFNL